MTSFVPATMGRKIILTGATGYVGEGVLLECLEHPAIDEVLVVGRRSCGRQHSKLKELLVQDFFTLGPVADRLRGVDGCFYCAGVSSVGKSEADFTRLTYDTTLAFASERGVSSRHAALFGWLVFEHLPDRIALGGILVIGVAAALIAIDSRRVARAAVIQHRLGSN